MIKAGRWLIYGVSIVAGIALFLAIWSKALQLLNARSDLSVLLGFLLIILTLMFTGLTIYLALRKVINNRVEQQTSSLNEAEPPKTLFSASINQAAEFTHEKVRPKHDHH